MKIFNRPIMVAGEPRNLGSVGFTAIEYDSSGKVRRATGLATPPASVAGFAVMCEFRDTVAKTTYRNTGTVSSSTWTEDTAGATGATGATGPTGPTFDTEVVTLDFNGAETSQTGACTSGSTVIGYNCYGVTGDPAASHLQLTVATTTLTGALTTAPGTGDGLGFRVTLKKA